MTYVEKEKNMGFPFMDYDIEESSFSSIYIANQKIIVPKKTIILSRQTVENESILYTDTILKQEV